MSCLISVIFMPQETHKYAHTFWNEINISVNVRKGGWGGCLKFVVRLASVRPEYLQSNSWLAVKYWRSYLCYADLYFSICRTGAKVFIIISVIKSGAWKSKWQAWVSVVVVQWLSHIRLFVTPWTAAHQASLSFTISQSVLTLMSIEPVMPSNHLVFCRPLLLLPSIFPSRVFSNESAPYPSLFHLTFLILISWYRL